MKIGELIDKILNFDYLNINIGRKHIFGLVIILGIIFGVNPLYNTVNKSVNPSLNNNDVNLVNSILKDDTIHIKTSNKSYSGYIKIYEYSGKKEQVNGSFKFDDFFNPGFLFRDNNGALSRIYFSNGEGSYKVTSDYFIIDGYGHINQKINYNDTANQTDIDITYNGVGIGRDKPYSDQFNIFNGGVLFYRSGEQYKGKFLLNNGSLIN